MGDIGDLLPEGLLPAAEIRPIVLPQVEKRVDLRHQLLRGPVGRGEAEGGPASLRPALFELCRPLPQIPLQGVHPEQKEQADKGQNHGQKHGAPPLSYRISRRRSTSIPRALAPTTQARPRSQQ
ncbi:hypothetical protein CE91St43_18060 [Oscillospiraceae bacterium]|nr:hypothetical protein CE91St43_18060 [Oscillospiraceae bacterium]